MVSRLAIGILSGALLVFAGGQAVASSHTKTHPIVNINGQPADGGITELGMAPGTYSANQNVEFVAQAGEFAAGAKFNWNWGDETPDTEGTTVKHAFADAGTYKVTLQTGTGGGTWSAGGTISVTAIKKPFDSQRLVLWGLLGLGALVLVVGGVWLVTRRRQA